ncbi:uncharacterized protein LOC116260726 [Nymphaea colorata]|nr:uncharacterized protein LOC116260726 [Nymphaea colorata]XP_049935579.1 uncharacterized protein LOC116260726 [Nymphaea colorata]
MREIVTIQVGGFANFIGSHFWNFQDELIGLADEPHGDAIFKDSGLDMDVFYRSGETQQGFLTYTPRLLSVDLPGSLGSLQSSGSLYEGPSVHDTTEIATWTGSVTKIVSEPHKKNLFLQSLEEEEKDISTNFGSNSVPKNGNGVIQQERDKDRVECLQKCVQFWTDFAKVHYHPRSLYELTGLWSDKQEFNNFGSGRDVFSRSLHGEEMSESLRFFVEECDHIQGFQFIVDDSGGFSNVATDFLENISDEYTSTPVLLYAARGPGNYTNILGQHARTLRALHDSVSFSRLSSFCKLMVPIGLPSLSKVSAHLCVDDEMPFHSSAVYAAGLHSISLPFRMSTLGPATHSESTFGALDVATFTQLLADQARQNMVSVLDIAMPAPPLPGEQNQRFVQRSLHPLTPDVKEEADDDAHGIESTVIHGALRQGGTRASITEVKEAFCLDYQNCKSLPLFSNISIALCPLPLPLPFPRLFQNTLGQHGEITMNPTASGALGSLDVFSIPMAARLRSSNAILPFIEKRLLDFRRYGMARGSLGSQLLQSWGFQRDELEDMAESQANMVQLLGGGSEGSSDSD